MDRLGAVTRRDDLLHTWDTCVKVQAETIGVISRKAEVVESAWLKRNAASIA